MKTGLLGLAAWLPIAILSALILYASAQIRRKRFRTWEDWALLIIFGAIGTLAISSLIIGWKHALVSFFITIVLMVPTVIGFFKWDIQEELTIKAGLLVEGLKDDQKTTRRIFIQTSDGKGTGRKPDNPPEPEGFAGIEPRAGADRDIDSQRIIGRG